MVGGEGTGKKKKKKGSTDLCLVTKMLEIVSLLNMWGCAMAFKFSDPD